MLSGTYFSLNGEQQIMYRVLVFVLLVFPFSVWANETFKQIERDYGTINTYRTKLFLDLLKKYGPASRTATVLKICGKRRLARQLRPKDNDIVKYLSENIASKLFEKGPVADTLNKNNNVLVTHLIKVSYFEWSSYELGYFEATNLYLNSGFLKNSRQKLCATMEVSAKGMLKKTK